MAGAGLVEVVVQGRTLAVGWADGHRGAFHALWLRDNCPCAECQHPATGQRLLETATIPADLGIAAARLTPDGVEVRWTDGAHAGVFAAGWLRQHCPCEPDRAARRRPRRFWMREGRPGLPEATHADVVGDARALAAWLAAIDAYGFAVLRGVPVAPGAVTRVVGLFGHVRETNYGRLFDVRSVLEPNNLAYTGLALSCHTDNPYRDPAPTLQLLHCLASSADGGESILVDGFDVAERLRAAAPTQFDLLCRIPVRFRFRDAESELEAEHPVITLDARGEVAAVRLNNRAKAALDAPADLVGRYYEAYLAFVGRLESPAHQLRFKLEPGDLFAVDNLRVLHGRTAFSSAGDRHLQGCYADMDGLRSHLAVLRRSAP